MQLKFNNQTLILKDEFLIEDFEIVKLPPVDLHKIAKGVVEPEDINLLVPWLHKFLKRMANNPQTKEYINTLSLPNLFGLIKLPDFTNYLKTAIGADQV